MVFPSFTHRLWKSYVEKWVFRWKTHKMANFSSFFSTTLKKREKIVIFCAKFVINATNFWVQQ